MRVPSPQGRSRTARHIVSADVVNQGGTGTNPVWKTTRIYRNKQAMTINALPQLPNHRNALDELATGCRGVWCPPFGSQTSGPALVTHLSRCSTGTSLTGILIAVQVRPCGRSRVSTRM